MRVDRVWLKNISNKPVIAVKLGWRLFTEKDRDSVLLRGETPLLGISLPAYSEETAKVKDPKLEFPLLTFTEKVIASLLKEKKLEGDYSIEVFVTEILFEDGSTWIETSSSSESLKVTPLVLSQRCPKQRCRFVSEGAYYMCEGSFLMESCSNAINSCCNVACQEGTVPECGG
ncbi:MAG: hypothetical protein RMM17_13945 [Acidobacteriota bacterium]|nr:hypothetical protein [Blastocatellia bacterium]MDW8413770.1 hypothetical protein [Acidobacteriota bacterium]